MIRRSMIAAALIAVLAGCASSDGARTGQAGAKAPPAAKVEAPEGVVYCGGGQVKRQIEYAILPKPKDKWNARVVINGKASRAMTSYSYFGKRQPPKGFIVALLLENRAEMLVFRDGGRDWLEYGDYTYRKCN